MSHIITVAKVSRKDANGEYRVRAYDHLGKPQTSCDYYTSDLEDAKETAKRMTERAEKILINVKAIATYHLTLTDADDPKEIRIILECLIRSRTIGDIVSLHNQLESLVNRGTTDHLSWYIDSLLTNRDELVI